jgi:4-hydroxythreonine-4-phosphate dehydrogenase
MEALALRPDLSVSNRIAVVGSRADLELAALRLARQWHPIELPSADHLVHLEIGQIGLIQPDDISRDPAEPGHPTSEGARAQLAFIDTALAAVLAGHADALVTGPVSKIAICRECTPFSGHTEHLARAAGIEPDQVTMLFAGPKLRVALTTTHLPLVEVSAALTRERVQETLGRVVTSLRSWWAIPRPKVAVLGLNPHAGEEGLLGKEELQVIAPAIERFRQTSLGSMAELTGPIPSEVGLRGAWEGRFDCVLAHYHDQATIPCKLLEMGRSVNVTLGLPFLRTSVDHGTAYDAAAAGKANPGSMVAALELAARLTGCRAELLRDRTWHSPR